MAVDQVLKRHFWLVILPLTGLAAFLAASGISEIARAALAVDAKELAAPPIVSKAAPSTGAASDHPTSADPILARNPFDSVTGPLNRVALDADAAAEQADLSDPMNAPPCDAVKILIIAQSADPEWSFAALSAGGPDAKSMLRRRGSDFNGKKVEYVGWDRVWLSSNGALCQAELFKPEDETPKAEASAAPPPASSHGGPPGVDPAIAKGIQRVSATEFNIDRSVVDKILENQAELMKQARIVPEQENGKLVGIRLFGVRQDTLLGTLGMENGDRLQTINGFDMTSPEKALEAYARLRTADHLTVSVNRKGANMNLDYNIK
ncbi:MAG: type II secretion system protein GspC [Polyangiaceae bacterium]